MKIVQTVLLLLFLQTSLLFAQDDSAPKAITVEDITKEMSKGKQPGFKTELYLHSKKTATEALTKFLKEQGKIKIEPVGNELISVAALVKSLAVKPVSMYFIMNEYETHVELLAFYEIENKFLTKDSFETEYLSAKKFTRNIAVYSYKASMQTIIDAEEKKLKGLESDMNKLHKAHDSLQKKISQEKQSIDNTREKIATSELDQERVRKQVQDQKEVVTKAKATSNEVLIKEEEKKLKTLESEVEKLQKQEDGFHKDITSSEALIRDHERDIETNKSDSVLKLADIEAQRTVIHKLVKKKEAIQ